MTKLEQLRAEIEQYKNDKFNCIGVNEVLKIIDKYADAEQEPKTGHWKPTIVRGSKSYICSECSAECCYVITNYCPSCGCRMIEPRESEDQE